MDRSALLARWNALAGRCQVSEPQAAACFRELADAYGESHRAYHNLTHIAHFLSELDTARIDDPAAEWAAWYHDVVYRPGAADNEALSAELAQRALTEMGVAAPVRDRTSVLILATRRHHADPNDAVAAAFLDADLAILGASPAVYSAYAEAIRKEHQHLPGLLYRSGRKRFLKGMLEKPRIFRTDDFHQRYEAQARENLARELRGG